MSTEQIPPSTEPVFVDTVVPVGPEAMRRKFMEPNVVFVLDYANSKTQGLPFMTYVSNLDVDSHVRITSEADALSLLDAYFKTSSLVRLYQVEDLAVNILLAAKGLEHGLVFDPAPFLASHAVEIEQWLSRIESLRLYSLHCIRTKAQLAAEEVLDSQGYPVPVDSKFAEYVQSYPEDDTGEMAGCNWVSLIKHPRFFELLKDVDESRLRNYTTYFNSYVFKGKNLFSYWGVPENPAYLVSLAMVDADFDPQVFQQLLLADLAEINKSNNEVS